MRKYQLITALLFILVASLTCAEEQPVQQYDFKRIIWGMSREEVKASENMTPSYEDEESVAYSVTICGLRAELFYIFTKTGKLSRAGYYIDEKHFNENLYITDFWTLREALIDKYGDPTSHDIIWRNRLYEDDYENWGLAVSIGHLVFSDSWETPRTRIELELYGDNFEIHLLIRYISKEFLEIEKQEKKSTDAANL